MDLNSEQREELEQQITRVTNQIQELRHARDEQVQIFEERQAQLERNILLNSEKNSLIHQNYLRRVNYIQQINNIFAILYVQRNAQDTRQSFRERREVNQPNNGERGAIQPEIQINVFPVQNFMQNQQQVRNRPIQEVSQNQSNHRHQLHKENIAEVNRQRQNVQNHQNHEVRNGIVQIILENPVQHGAQNLHEPLNNHEAPNNDGVQHQPMQQEPRAQQVPQIQPKPIIAANVLNIPLPNINAENFDDSNNQESMNEDQIYQEYPEDMQDHPRDYVMQKFGILAGKYDKFTQSRRHGIFLPRNAYYMFHYYKKINFNEFQLYNWSNLLQLNAIGCGIDDDNFAAFIKEKNSYPNLMAVLLSCNDIRTVTEDMLNQFPRLVYINFGLESNSNPNMTPESIQQLDRFRARNPHKRVKYYRPVPPLGQNRQI